MNMTDMFLRRDPALLVGHARGYLQRYRYDLEIVLHAEVREARAYYPI